MIVVLLVVDIVAVVVADVVAVVVVIVVVVAVLMLRTLHCLSVPSCPGRDSDCSGFAFYERRQKACNSFAHSQFKMTAANGREGEKDAS